MPKKRNLTDYDLELIGKLIEVKVNDGIDDFKEETGRDYERVITILQNQAGTLEKIEQEVTLISHHSSKQSDKLEEQDSRLDKLELSLQ